jgi:opacity protein-like surface antigen
MKRNQLKYFILALVLFAGLTETAVAQKQIRLNAYSSYACADNQVSSGYNSYNAYYEGSINGGLQWGGGLEMLVAPNKGIELKYLRQDAVGHMDYYNGTGGIGSTQNDFDLAINYILLGGTNYFKLNEKVEPFAGGGIGMAIISVENPTLNIEDPTKEKFAWNIKLGTNVWISEKVALKLQAELVSPVQSFGGGFYVGTGGAGAGVTGVSTFYQFTFGGGLVFNVGK